MKYKTAQDYDRDIRTLTEAVAEVKSTIHDLRALKYGEQQLTKGGMVSNDNGLTNQIQWIMDQEKKIAHLISERIKLIDTIEQLPAPTHRAICRLRFIKGWTFEEIADYLHCSKSDVYRKHGRAVKELKKLLK